jgi:Right handed beta helix region/Protein of unknown function (DUF1565)
MARSSHGWRHVALGVAVLAVLALGVLQIRTLQRAAAPPPAAAPAPAPSAPATTPAPAPLRVVYVDPAGADTNDGSAGAPLRTIQAGLETATPGTEIRLAPGVYREELATVRDGAPGAPITIKGPETGKDRAGRYRAVVYGTGRVVSIDHSWYTLDGFTIDGQEKLSGTRFPTDFTVMTAFKDRVRDKVADGRLVYVGADERTRDLTGITLHNMFLSGAGGECVRFRNGAHDSAVTDSVIQYCGLYGKGNGKKRAVYHNGEGVYIGTSPNSEDQPMHADDPSARIVVARNVIRTFGSECFNVKENAHDNVFEDNVCAGNTEPLDNDGSNVELRGYANVVRDNQIADSAGVSVKIRTDGAEYDRGGNVVENNRISGSAAALMLDSKAAQGPMCGNVVSTATVVDADDDGAAPGDITAPCRAVGSP